MRPKYCSKEIPRKLRKIKKLRKKTRKNISNIWSGNISTIREKPLIAKHGELIISTVLLLTKKIIVNSLQVQHGVKCHLEVAQVIEICIIS